MEERSTSGMFLSMNPTTPAWETETTTLNGSSSATTPYCIIDGFSLYLLTLLVALVGLAGNTTVLWILGFRMRMTSFTVYILNLAGADFFFLCLQVVNGLLGIMFTYSIVISFPGFVTIMFTFCYLAGLSMLSAIGTERCLSVLWPIWYRCRRPRHTSAIVCALLWALSLVLSLLEGNECGFLHEILYYDWCQTLDFITAAWLIVLFTVLCGSSVALLVRIFCGLGRIPVTRLYVTIVLTVLVFLLFGLPFGIHWFLLIWIRGFHSAFPCDALPVTTFLSTVNSCANPIIYFLVGSMRHRRFQQRTLKLVLQRAMQDTPEEGESGDTGSP